ncbi:MAG: T9SS type A sorting domain-containing protein, partial [Bacteroidales bacterium]|nr:T9SS type A sorting domain-containing protein [Bacteroidales bacterium]
EKFEVHPNPTNNWLYIKKSITNYIYNIELRNLYGQLVKEEKNIQSSHYVMNVADLTAGVYFYVIRQQNKIIQQGKLIIK